MLRRALVFSLLALGLAACESRSLKFLDAGAVSWEDFRGRWVVINYWAEWCKPCRKEMPELNQLHGLYSDEVAVLGVNFDRPQEEDLRRQVVAMGVRFPVLAEDPSAVLGYSRPAVLPTTLIFDTEGQLIRTLIGPQSMDSLKKVMGLQALQSEKIPPLRTMGWFPPSLDDGSAAY